MIVILNQIDVITTYGNLLYEAINKEVVMKKIGDRYTNNIFENIKHIDEYGNEYWYARELQKVLEYKDWRNFLKVLNKAKDACKNSGFNIDEQFVEVNRLSKRNNNATANIQDYKLSRYICYLIVQNADSSKEVVALGQTYFAIQTRKQEITEQEYDSLSDDEKRFYQSKVIILRKELPLQQVLKIWLSFIMQGIKVYIMLKQLMIFLKEKNYAIEKIF